jgi:hypothetical protein
MQSPAVTFWVARRLTKRVYAYVARREAREPEREPASDEGIERRAMLFQLVDTLPTDQRRVVVGRFAEQAASMARAEEPAGAGGEGEWLRALWRTGWIA